MSVFCRWGWHSWEDDPSGKEYLRMSGLHVVFSSYCYQAATQKCTGCDATRRVYRSGMMGLGGGESVTGWKRMSSGMEDYINSLPVL